MNAPPSNMSNYNDIITIPLKHSHGYYFSLEI